MGGSLSTELLLLLNLYCTQGGIFRDSKGTLVLELSATLWYSQVFLQTPKFCARICGFHTQEILGSGTCPSIATLGGAMPESIRGSASAQTATMADLT